MQSRSTLTVHVHPKKVFFSILVLLIVFRIPRLLGVPAVYSIRYMTRSIGESYELFSITIVEILFVLLSFLFSILLSKKGISTKFWWILLYIVIVNCIRYLLSISNPISLNSYEAILSLTISFACAAIIIYFYTTSYALETFFDVLITLCFISQIIYVLIGNGKNGSYGCLALSSGGLALCYSTYILIKLVLDKTNLNYIYLIISSIGLLLTGSRTHLALLLLFVINYVIFKLEFNDSRKWIIIISLIMVPLLLVSLQDYVFSKKISGLFDLFSNGFVDYVINDASFLERRESIMVALSIIKDNPLGISSSVIDLQSRMFDNGATTFPHSYFLCYYLLFGLPTIFILYKVFILYLSLKKQQANQQYVILYLFIVLLFYGGISTSPILFFWIFLVYLYARKKTPEFSSGRDENVSNG